MDETPAGPPLESPAAAVGWAPTVGVLWAHGDELWSAQEHADWQSTVYTFTTLLRACGIDADMDLFHSHEPTDWARFGPSAVRNSDFVVIAVSNTWRRAWDGDLETGYSAGALGEANALHGLYQKDPEAFLRRVIPVVLPGASGDAIPQQLRATTHWVRVTSLATAGLEDLLRRITRQPAFPKPPLGAPLALPPRMAARAQDAVSPADQQAIAAELGDTEHALTRLPETSDDPTVNRARDALEARHASLLARVEELLGRVEAVAPAGSPATAEPAFVPVGPGPACFHLQHPSGPLKGMLRYDGGVPVHVEEVTLTTALGDFAAEGIVPGSRADRAPGHTLVVNPGEQVGFAFGEGQLAALVQTSPTLTLRIVYRVRGRLRLEYHLELLRYGSTVDGRPQWKGRSPRTLAISEPHDASGARTSAAAPGAPLPPEPDYLPSSTLVWASEHRDILNTVVDELLQTGEWPSVSNLTRGFARARNPQPVRAILQDAPRGIGFVESYPERIVLLLFGLRLSDRGQRLLDGFMRMLRLAIERYEGDSDAPALRRADLADEEPAVARALSEIINREAPFLGNGTGAPDGDWERAITDDVVRYWMASSSDDFLRIRAQELRY